MPLGDASEQAHQDAGDGVERTVTQARGGVRRGVNKILVISTALAVAVMGLIWLVAARPTTPSPTQQAATTAAAAQPGNTLRTRAWDQSRLGAQGMAKCSAFRQVLVHTRDLQNGATGALSASQRSALDDQLKAAKAMEPAALTPFQCGVPIG